MAAIGVQGLFYLLLYSWATQTFRPGPDSHRQPAGLVEVSPHCSRRIFQL